jgi:hypothetical protein
MKELTTTKEHNSTFVWSLGTVTYTSQTPVNQAPPADILLVGKAMPARDRGAGSGWKTTPASQESVMLLHYSVSGVAPAV